MREEKKALYPLPFAVESEKKVWGEEIRLIGDTGLSDSTVTDGWMAGNTLSELMDTYTERIVGDKVMAWYGRQFPVMAKVLDIKGRNSLQVHPDDEIAAQRYDALGKKTLWYILEAGKEARLWLGFRKDTDAGELYAACQDGSVKKLLNSVVPRPGESWLIAPGTLHAAQDVKILEISEASEMNFRIYDWGRAADGVSSPEASGEDERPILLEDALDFIDYRKLPAPALCPLRSDIPLDQRGKEPLTPLCEEEEFVVRRLAVNDPLHIRTEQYEGFILYACVGGEVSVQCRSEGRPLNTIVPCGQCVLIPADMEDFFLVPQRKDTVLLEIFIARSETDDGYAQEAQD